LNTPNICKIRHCGNSVRAKQMCSKHYQKWRKYGDPEHFIQISSSDKLDFINEAINSQTDECIIWPYSLACKGYGEIQIDGIRWLAHAYVLTKSVGPRPQKHDAAHAPVICHNRACVNPRHLRWATRSENQKDRVLDGTDLGGDKSPVSKLTQEQVDQIKKSKAPQYEIAKLYGVNQSQISRIKNKKRWA